MRVYDIIQKKRDNASLTSAEIDYIISGFTRGDIPDYQMSALLMAIYFNGMDARELTELTEAMTRSGDTVDLSAFGDQTVDKHSTGGVGDKTTLIVAPIVATLGGVVAKMSGRGLGHTGGTVDKLEAIPGYRTTMDRAAFLAQVQHHGVAVIGQSGHIAPADKKIYALRDVTATVESIPLIASSIMSKKLAAGAKNIVLDVKAGSGAFMKSVDDARRLAETMVGIGRGAGRRMTAVVTNMDVPLGRAVGNALEVLEAAEVLSRRSSDGLLYQICRELSARMLCLCHGWTYARSCDAVDTCVAEGAALNKFRDWIVGQGGDAGFIDDPSRLGAAAFQVPFAYAGGTGYIAHMDAETIGKAASALGAGREKTGDTIDPLAGIVLQKSTGDFVKNGDTIAVMHTSDERRINDALSYLSHENALTFSTDKPEPQPLIYDVVT